MLLRILRNYLDFAKGSEYDVQPESTAKYMIAMGIGKKPVELNNLTPEVQEEIISDPADDFAPTAADDFAPTAAEEPASEEPASEEPASEEPASEEPASEEPAKIRDMSEGGIISAPKAKNSGKNKIAPKKIEDDTLNLFA